MATLLYVDDNQQRMQALMARFERLGYRVLAANDGDEALRIFARKRINLAVVDYYMHGMGGDLVALEMKKLRPQVPIIIFSGTFTLPEMVIALVDGFVFTGDEPDKLMHKIAELLPRSKRKRRASQGRAQGAA